MLKENFIDYIEKGIKENWDLNAFTNYRGDTLTYRQTAIEILKLHHIFKALDLKKRRQDRSAGKKFNKLGDYISCSSHIRCGNCADPPGFLKLMIFTIF